MRFTRLDGSRALRVDRGDSATALRLHRCSGRLPGGQIACWRVDGDGDVGELETVRAFAGDLGCGGAEEAVGTEFVAGEFVRNSVVWREIFDG